MALPVLTLRLALLALLLSWPAALAAAPSPGKVLCLGCHPPHHAGRGGCVFCHRGNPATDRKDVAHAGFLPAAYSRFTLPGDPSTARGREALSRSGCRRCHVSGAEGIRLAADLDAAFGARPARLRDAIRNPAAFMPDFRFDDATILDLVNAIYANGTGRTKKAGKGAEIPIKVHFDAGPAKGDAPPFAKRCGGCHRALSGNGAGMGAGAAGPNLSALFSPFHPGQASEGLPWNPEALRRWLSNPRSFRPFALMPPVPLPAEEFPALADSLRTGADRSLAGIPRRLNPGAGGAMIER